MSTLKAILVDDERNAIKALEAVLRFFPEITIARSYTNPLQALEHMADDEFDIAFLDIDMPGINGLELAERLSELRPAADVVFTTAYDQYALEAFEVNAADYLLKPVRRERLAKTISNLAKRRRQPEEGASRQGCIVCFGSFQLLIPELQMRVKWRTNKTQELFAYLVHHRRDSIHKSKIMEDLWPHMEPERAAVHLHTSVYQIRKTIRQFGLDARIAIHYANDSYHLTLRGIPCDADAFIEGVENLAPIAPETAGQYEQVAALYRGHYLEENDYLWALPLRQKLLLHYTDAVRQLIDFRMGEGEYVKASAHLQRLISLNPLLEEFHERLLMVYAELGERAALMLHYRTMEELFAEEGLELKPSIRSLYHELLERFSQ